jgi:hypothetical protein
MPSDPYTPADVARMLGFTPKTIRSWCANGVFPNARKWPNNNPRSEWRIPAHDVEAQRRRQAGALPVDRNRLNELMDLALAKSA